MTIHIKLLPEDGCVVLHLDGWLEGADVSELERIVTDAVEDGLMMDLAELRTADKLGIEVLRSFAYRGIPFRHVPPTIAVQLEIDRRRIRAARNRHGESAAKRLKPPEET